MSKSKTLTNDQAQKMLATIQEYTIDKCLFVPDVLKQLKDFPETKNDLDVLVAKAGVCDSDTGDETVQKIAALVVATKVKQNSIPEKIKECIKAQDYQGIFDIRNKLSDLFAKSNQKKDLFRNIDDITNFKNFKEKFINTIKIEKTDVKNVEPVKVLNSLARILGYGTACAAVLIDKDILKIAFNEEYPKKLGSSTERIRHVKEVLEYLHKKIDPNSDGLEGTRNKIIIKIAKKYDLSMSSNHNELDLQLTLERHIRDGTTVTSLQKYGEQLIGSTEFAIARTYRDLMKIENNLQKDNCAIKNAIVNAYEAVKEEKFSKIIITSQPKNVPDKKGDKIHAEMRLIEYSYEQGSNQNDLNNENIGISKLCCGLCYRALRLFGIERSTHGLIFEWYIIDAIKNTTEKLKEFLGDACEIYDGMKEEIKEFALTAIVPNIHNFEKSIFKSSEGKVSQVAPASDSEVEDEVQNGVLYKVKTAANSIPNNTAQEFIVFLRNEWVHRDQLNSMIGETTECWEGY